MNAHYDHVMPNLGEHIRTVIEIIVTRPFDYMNCHRKNQSTDSFNNKGGTITLDMLAQKGIPFASSFVTAIHVTNES